MPELPEVETVRRVMRRALGGKRIARAEVVNDSIVCESPPEGIRAALEGATVVEIGRRGKTWWLELDRRPWLGGHLGMSGWIRELGAPTTRLMEHGNAPLDDENGRPRFLKLLLEAEDGARVAFTDGRRLGRLWLMDEGDARLAKLGPDALDEMPDVDELAALFSRRKAPIKAVLMDQETLAGVGNYLADEALYQAGIAPKRSAASLDKAEVATLRDCLLRVMREAIEVEADYERFPAGWLFLHRWGGKKGSDEIEGQPIVRETVGGRTTAWVPTRQR